MTFLLLRYQREFFNARNKDYLWYPLFAFCNFENETFATDQPLPGTSQWCLLILKCISINFILFTVLHITMQQ